MDMAFLKGKLVYLRNVEESDLKWFKEYRNNYEDSKNYRTVKPLTDFNQKEYWVNVVNSPNHIVFTIVEQKSNALIGEIRCSNINFYRQTGEIGLFLRPQSRKKGYASEALQLFLEFIFGRANINRIEAQVTTNNVVSYNFFLRNGFVKEGVLRQATYYNFEYQDVVVMSMLKKDWMKEKLE